jgi:hypothetical protein
MEELEMLAIKHPEVTGAVEQVRRMSPVRALRELIFEYEDARCLRMGQDAYVREEGRAQGYKEAEGKYQEAEAKHTERIRQLEEENRRLRG